MRSKRRSRSAIRCGCALLLIAALAACAPLAPRSAELATGPAVELNATPFHAQDKLQCGPAALATLLGASGHSADPAATPQALEPLLFVPARGGALQDEMLAQARRFGAIALPIAPTDDALVAELRAGRPVLVLQNNGLSWYPLWHYAVVIGYDPAADDFVLRSGVTERLVETRRSFDATWARSGRWGFVLLAPGQLPAHGDGSGYARAIAAFEAGATPGDARRAWEAGQARWPQRWELAFGLGNRRYADGALGEATAAFARAAMLAPDQPAPWNNLAVAQMDAGRWDEALASAERAAALSTAPDILATLREARCRRMPDCR